MKNLFKNIKQLLATISTLLIIVVLFGVIFVRLGLTKPGPTFFLELTAICILVVTIKANWYNWAEDKKEKEDKIVNAIKTYDDYADKEITNIYDFEEYLVELNAENRKNYVTKKLGKRTPENCPNYAELKAKYEKLALKRVKDITACDVKTRGESTQLFDAKNYQKQKKMIFQTISTVLSIAVSIVLACIAFDELMVSWENVFRYVAYLCTISITIWTTVTTAFKNTENEIMDHITRLQFIVDRYVNYKEGKSKNGNKGSKTKIHRDS